MIPFGTPRRHVAQCGSTNDLAREWACDPVDPAPSGALVTAGFQTHGRGQRGRQWESGTSQSALMSFVYRLPTETEVSQLGLVVALAVADAVASVTHLDPRIKWPNDILLDGRKVAGILVEAAPSPPLLGAGRAILGIGINVHQERFDGAEGFVYPPTSLRLETGQVFDLDTVIAAVGQAISQREDRLRRDGFLPIMKECRARLAVGAWVRQGENRAELMGLDPNGAAYVRLTDGTFAVWSTVD